jgi:hypothetical protein
MSTASKGTDLDTTEKEDFVYLEGDSRQATADDPNWRVKISPEEKKLIRKLDMKLLPFLCAVGFLQFLDKTSLSYASVLGIIQDTHLFGSQYGALGSLFYVGYLAMQVKFFWCRSGTISVNLLTALILNSYRIVT